MRIGELSTRCSVSVETIRFYEAKGLLTPPCRLSNGYREYTATHMTQLHFICHCRSLGMGLDEIGILMRLDAANAKEAAKVHAIVQEQISRVTARIKEMQELKKHLQALSHRCSGEHTGKPCGILVGLTNDANDGVCHCQSHRHQHGK